MTISELEGTLEEYKYPTACDLEAVLKAFELAKRWLKHPTLKHSRAFLAGSLMEYYRKRDKKQFVYGRALYWLLGIFETLNRE